jgi:hypothetical protein
MVEMWSTELDQRQQKVGETVDQYASTIRELYQRVNTPAFAYPDNVQARKFVSGLFPELYMAVKPFGDLTLTDAINRAKVCELTLASGRTKLLNFAQQEKTETTELIKLVTNLTNHVAELEKKLDTKVRTNTPRQAVVAANNNNNSTSVQAQNRPPIICYTCGEPGHISRRCPQKDENPNTTSTANRPSTSNTSTPPATNVPTELRELLRQLNASTQQQSLN